MQEKTIATQIDEIEDEVVSAAVVLIPNLGYTGGQFPTQVETYHVGPEGYATSDITWIVAYEVSVDEVDRDTIGQQGFLEAIGSIRITFVLPTSLRGGTGRYSKQSKNLPWRKPDNIGPYSEDPNLSQQDARHSSHKVVRELAHTLGEQFVGGGQESTYYTAYSVEEQAPTTLKENLVLFSCAVDLSFETEGCYG